MRWLPLILASSTAVASLSCGGTLEPSEFVREYIELHRRGDVSGLLALHTNDAEFVIPGQSPIRGIGGLRDLFEWDAVLESQLSMEGITQRGDTIIVENVTERNHLFERLGVPEVQYSPGTRFVLRNGLIAGVYPADFSRETAAVIAQKFNDLIPWLSAYRPAEQQQLLPDGQFQYNAASARLWLQVLEDWRQSDSVAVPSSNVRRNGSASRR